MWRPVNAEYGATILQEIPRSQGSPICCNGKAAKVRCIPSGRRIPTSTAPCFLSHFGTCKSACFTSFNGQLSAGHWSPNSWPLLTWFSAVEARSAKCFHVYCISIHRSCSVHVQLKHVFEIWVALLIWLLVRQLLEVWGLSVAATWWYDCIIVFQTSWLPWLSLSLHCLEVLNCISFSSNVSYCFLLFLIVSYCFLLFLIVSYCFLLFLNTSADYFEPRNCRPQTTGFLRSKNLVASNLVPVRFSSCFRFKPVYGSKSVNWFTPIIQWMYVCIYQIYVESISYILYL